MKKNKRKLGLQIEKAFSTLTKHSSTNDPLTVQTAMKTTTSFHYSNFPLRIAPPENSGTEKKLEVNLVLKSDLRNHRFAFIQNNQIEDTTNWDASWFGNYE